MADHEPMADGACGDPALTPELRDALTLLRDRSDDEEFRTLVDDVLAERCSLVEASATAAFGKVVFARVAQDFTERFGRLTDEERRAVAAEGEARQEEHGTPCGAPCGGCAGVCAVLGTGPS